MQEGKKWKKERKKEKSQQTKHIIMFKPSEISSAYHFLRVIIKVFDFDTIIFGSKCVEMVFWCDDDTTDQKK